jgi:nitrile hydratase subunit beta
VRDDRPVDGVHDLGGLHGFGRVPVEHERPFHDSWEGRVWAMAGAVTRRTTTDRFRFMIEQMPPASYLDSAYFERWLWAIERLAAEQGLFDGAGSEPLAHRPSPTAPLWPGRFEPGDRVRVANRVTEGHCRVPRYLRRQVGLVERIACAWPSPAESAANGRYGEPELVYTVVFSGESLFGPRADHAVSADLGEGDLEVA